MTSSTDFDELEVQQQYSNVNTRWECLDEDLDNDNSSARLFERSRIKALAGTVFTKQTPYFRDAKLHLNCIAELYFLFCSYPNVNITNFTTSWKDGMAFNALIHKHRSDLVDFDKLKKSNPTHNLRHAFDVAEQQLGVTKLLDPEDVFTENPDEKSIITYVVAFYHYFSKMKALAVEGKRVGKVLDHAIETEKMIEKYESLASDLLTWIEQTIITLNSRTFANSLTGVQQQLQAFNSYRTTEKPPKFQEKGNLEVMLYTIQSRMRANNQKLYTPHEGALVSDINRGWERLEKAEHGRELALRNELIRQEKLEQLARRFDRKAAMRETWLIENQRLVAQDNFGLDLLAVEAAKKKHDAIETDIGAYQERVQALLALSNELEAENYHDSKRINARKDNILRLWEYLLELLSARRARLEMNLALQKTFQEMLHIIIWMDDMKDRLLSPDFGKHLLEVEDLLQKHCLVEADIAVQAERVRSANTAALRFTEGDGYKPCDPQVIKDRVQHLDLCYQELCALAAQRKARLQQSRRLWNFFWEMDEIESWIKEKEHIFSTMDYGKDLTSVMILQSKHSAFEDELGARRAHLQQTAKEGEKMVKGKHFGSPKIKERSEDILRQWEQLEDLATFRKQNLRDAQNFFQFQGDADDLKAWLQDTYRIMSSNDVGHDEYSTQLLAKKHRDLQNEAIKYRGTMEALIRQADSLPDELRSTPDIQRRLKDIKELYVDLLSLADQRRQKLQDTMALYTIFSETDACGLWMNQKKTWLVGLETPGKLEELEIVQNRLEILGQEMNNVETRVADVNQAAKQLEDSRHPSVREVKECQNRLNRRYNTNLRKAKEVTAKLKDNSDLQHFLQNTQDLTFWINEKMLTAQDTSYDEARNLHSKWQKHKAFMAELASNKDWLDKIDQEGEQLMLAKPELTALVSKRLDEVHRLWDELESTTQDKAQRLFDANRSELLEQSYSDLDRCLKDLSQQLQSEDYGKDLTSANILLKKHQVTEKQVEERQRELVELLSQDPLKDGSQTGEYAQVVEKKFQNLLAPLRQRREKLQASRAVHQFYRDLADEILWVEERLPLATSTDHGNNMQTVQLLMKKNQTLQKEIQGHQPRIAEVLERGDGIIAAGTPDSDGIREQMGELQEIWKRLQDETAKRRERLRGVNEAQQYYMDAAEAEAWIGEQELYMIADEKPKLWVEERLPLATSTDHGNNMQAVQLLMKKNQTLQKEIQGHQPRIAEVLERGDGIIAAGTPDSDGIREQMGELQEIWKRLQDETAKRRERLRGVNEAQQYYMDAAEAEAWIGEQELYMIADEKPKDEQSAMVMLKRHLTLQQSVCNYTDSIKQLADRAQKLLAQDHPEGYAIESPGGSPTRCAARLHAQYVGDQADAIQHTEHEVVEAWKALLDACDGRRTRLVDTADKFRFFSMVRDLMSWMESIIRQIETQEKPRTGAMRDKFRDFARDTGSIGQERVDSVNRVIDGLIDREHSEAATMAEWKDNLNESWGDLLELIDTRSQLLTTSYDLHKYFYDGKELLALLQEKHTQLPADVGGDVSTAESFHRMHAAFERDIHTLGKQVQQFQDSAARLHAQYVGDQADAIQHTEHEVVEAWKALLDACDGRRTRLVDTADKFRFFSMVRDLMSWMESIIRQIETQEKPRDVSSVELLMKYHQGIKAEMDARNRSFSTCVDLGMALLARKHQASQELRVISLQAVSTQTPGFTGGEAVENRSFSTCVDLGMALLARKHQASQEFSRDASVAEAWLIAQEPYVASRDYGQTVAEVEKLLKRHEAFEKSTATWEERLAALERLTTLELLEVRKQQQAVQQMMRDQAEEQRGVRRDDSKDITGDSSHFHTAEEQTLVSGVEEKPDLLNGREFSEDTSFERTDKSELDESSGQRPSQSLLLPAPTETERAATLPTPTQRHQAVQREGALVRKHDLEGPDKRASNRLHDGSEYLFQAKDEEELQSWVQAVQNAIPQQGESQGPSTEGRAHSLPTQPSTSASRDSGGGKKDKEKRFSNPFTKKK
ncbi:UNVERIFIED_CONTAM: hypothetical protein FKN15_027822 [Acipenser sinensis]